MGRHHGDHRLVQATDLQRHLPQVVGPLDRPEPWRHPAVQLHLVRLALPQHVQDVALSPDGQRRLVQPGPQLRRVARLPDPDHILALGQARSGELRGGAAPVARQQRGEAVRDRLPAGRRPFGVGDRRVAERDFLASLVVGPDGEPILGGPGSHTRQYGPLDANPAVLPVSGVSRSSASS
jgi:hypothetical protein